MKTIVNTVLILQTFIVASQHYESKNLQDGRTATYVELSKSNSEQVVEDFFNLDISFQQINGADRFFFIKDNGKYKLVLSLKLRDRIKDNSSLKQIIYAKLATYAFEDDFAQNLSSKERELISDMVAGYFYCYQNITKNWKELKDKNTILIKKSLELDDLKEAYSETLNSYKNKNLETSITAEERIDAFLKGTYLAMPVNYRQHITSAIVINDDINLLIKEAQNLRTYIMASTFDNLDN